MDLNRRNTHYQDCENLEHELRVRVERAVESEDAAVDVRLARLVADRDDLLLVPLAVGGVEVGHVGHVGVWWWAWLERVLGGDETEVSALARGAR